MYPRVSVQSHPFWIELKVFLCVHNQWRELFAKFISYYICKWFSIQWEQMRDKHSLHPQWCVCYVMLCMARVWYVRFFFSPFFLSWLAFVDSCDVSLIVLWMWTMHTHITLSYLYRYGAEHIIKCVINNCTIFFSVMVVAVIVCHVLRRFIYIFPLSPRWICCFWWCVNTLQLKRPRDMVNVASYCTHWNK